MITEICHIIKAVIAEDKEKALSYARLLAENLDKDGKHKEATRVHRALSGEHGVPVVMDDIEKDFPSIYPSGKRVRF